MEANKAQDRAIGEAKRASWRRFTEEASRDSSKLWRLEKWARTRSGLPPEPAQLPELQGDHPGDPVAATFEEKTQALAARFFPSQKADCTGIQDQQFHDDSFQASFQMDDPINEHEVKQAIQRAGSWSAPGLDGIPAGLLKACGSHLVQVLQPLIQASFDLEYFPKRFRTAVVAVVPKPNKTPAQRKKVGGWRPISLLNTVGKVFESIIGRRIASAAEQHNLFPDEQMGNRAQRSTMLAVKLVLESVRTAWSRKAVTSLLQLDLKGAYDSVDHLHLLNNLRHIGFPPKVVRWVHSFLSDRSAQLQFDGRKSSFIQLVVGVPQGSPLSPVLFLLYIASLYTRLKEKHGILVVGFSDDTNILSVGRDTAATVRQLEGAWKECEDWAKENGMAFQPEKSELMHFTKGRAADVTPLRLGPAVITPVSSARFLGIWLNRKLNWKPQLKKLEQKLERQCRALTGIAASTWGCSLTRAREIYTKVIRSAIAYGAPAYHVPTEPGGNPQGCARNLAKHQSACLRTVLGAYKATPIRQLETEAAVPPLDLYLNYRLANFERRLKASGKAEVIRRWRIS